MENKFFTFFKPYFDYIDDGSIFRKPYSWFYLILGIANLLFPFYVLYQAISNHFFDFGGKVIFIFILVWIILLFAGWLSFQLWWNRKAKVETITADGDDFVGTPVFSHLIQTLGEWLGTYIAIVGGLLSLLISLFFGSESGSISSLIGVSFINISLMGIVLMPLYGFFIIGLSRFIAELARALAAIANNTKNQK